MGKAWRAGHFFGRCLSFFSGALLFLCGVLGFAIEIRKDDILDLQQGFNLRAIEGDASLGANYLKTAQNVVLTGVPKGTKVQVLEVKQIKTARGNWTGNYGLQIKILSPKAVADRVGTKPQWVFYKVANPAWKLACQGVPNPRCTDPRFGAQGERQTGEALRDVPIVAAAAVDKTRLAPVVPPPVTTPDLDPDNEAWTAENADDEDNEPVSEQQPPVAAPTTRIQANAIPPVQAPEIKAVVSTTTTTLHPTTSTVASTTSTSVSLDTSDLVVGSKILGQNSGSDMIAFKKARGIALTSEEQALDQQLSRAVPNTPDAPDSPKVHNAGVHIEVDQQGYSWIWNAETQSYQCYGETIYHKCVNGNWVGTEKFEEEPVFGRAFVPRAEVPLGQLAQLRTQYNGRSLGRKSHGSSHLEQSSYRGPSPTRISQGQCSDRDLRNDYPNLLKGPDHIRNQDGMGYCYAFTLADVLSVHTGTVASAADIGLLTHEVDGTPVSNSSDKFASAMRDGAFHVVDSAGGVCPESVMPSNDYAYSLVAGDEDLRAYRNTHFGLQARLLETERLHAKIRATPESDVSSLSTDGTCRQFARVQQLFNVDVGQIIAVAQKTAKVDEFEDWLRNLSCEGKRQPLPNGNVVWAEIGSSSGHETDPLMGAINAGLDDHHVVGVRYDVRLVDPNFKIPKNSDNSDSSPLHDSSVIGRRWKSGTCQLLLRNSWGAGAGICNTLYSQYNERGDCNKEDGTLWINEAELRYRMAPLGEKQQQYGQPAAYFIKKE